VAPGRAVGLPAGAGDRRGASDAAGDRIVGRARRRLAARHDGPGEYDLALGPLITALHAPAVAAGLPTRAPAEQGKRGYVWHCSARVAGTDRILSDGEWAGIARELLDGAGSRSAAMSVGRGGWRCGTPRTTSILPSCWCARTRVGGFGRTTTTRSYGPRPGGSSSASAWLSPRHRTAPPQIPCSAEANASSLQRLPHRLVIPAVALR
jgi:hypothetical protein